MQKRNNPNILFRVDIASFLRNIMLTVDTFRRCK